MSIKNAKWITSDAYQKHQSFSFVKELRFNKAPEKVYLDISAKGLYLVYIDSMLVSDSLFAPGWTSYSNRVQYETLDIGDYLRGKPCSTLEIKLAEGWCCGRMGWKDEVDNKFAPQPALRASLKLKYGDLYEYIDTDESWNAFTNEITFSSIYDGESIDFNRIREPFGKTVIDDSPFGELVPWEGEKIIEHTSVPAKEIIRTPAGGGLWPEPYRLCTAAPSRPARPDGDHKPRRGAGLKRQFFHPEPAQRQGADAVHPLRQQPAHPLPALYVHGLPLHKNRGV